MEFLDRLSALEELRVLEKEILCPVHLNSPKKYSVMSTKILDFHTCCTPVYMSRLVYVIG